MTRYLTSRLGLLAISLNALSAITATAQSFTLDDAERVRQPREVTVSADGSTVAYVVGDSLWVRATRGPGKPRLVSTGMARAGGWERPFIALSRAGDRLAFRTGTGGLHDEGVAMVASIGREVIVRPLLPDSLTFRLQTFRHFAAGGPAWSPDGQHLVFLAADTARYVGRFSLQVYVFSLSAATITPWTSDSSMKYSVAFSPDGRWLAVGTGAWDIQRATVDLFDFAAGPGSAREIASASARYYHDLFWSPSGDRLLAQSHTYEPILLRVQPNGMTALLPERLPRGRYRGWTGDGAALLTTEPRGMLRAPALRRISGGARAALTLADELTVPYGIGSTAGEDILVYARESGELPRDIWSARVVTAERPALLDPVQLTDANPGLASALPMQARIHRWSSDGVQLESQLFLPRNVRRPLPLVVLPYGGYTAGFPQSEYFLDVGILPLLSTGWAVARPNTRGRAGDPSPVGRYGEIQLRDTEALVSDLAERGIIDEKRVAVIGHSHGGSMAYYYLTHSNRFCAVSAINGRADWVAQAEYGDAYLVSAMGGKPERVPDLYQRGSPVANARAATAPLLAVAGAKDSQILSSNATAMVDSMRVAGRKADLLLFTDEGHLIADRRNREQMWRAIWDHLKSSCSP